MNKIKLDSVRVGSGTFEGYVDGESEPAVYQLLNIVEPPVDEQGPIVEVWGTYSYDYDGRLKVTVFATHPDTGLRIALPPSTIDTKHLDERFSDLRLFWEQSLAQQEYDERESD